VSEEPSAAEFLTPALDAAEAAGVLVVTGAGIFGTDIDAEPLFPASLTHPNLISVGASTPWTPRRGTPAMAAARSTCSPRASTS